MNEGKKVEDVATCIERACRKYVEKSFLRACNH